jgi:hypothetical protein
VSPGYGNRTGAFGNRPWNVLREGSSTAEPYCADPWRRRLLEEREQWAAAMRQATMDTERAKQEASEIWVSMDACDSTCPLSKGQDL